MRGLYIVTRGIGETGIDNKIKSQIKSFESHGINIDVFSVSDKEIPFLKVIARLPYTNVMPEWKEIKDCSQYDFVYMRRPGYMSKPFLNYLKRIKENNNRIKIIMEIPSFPYDKEYTSRISQIPFLLKDRYARKSIHNYIDYISDLGSEGEIFGVNTVHFYNGYDFSQLRVRKAVDISTVSIIAVARFCEWHGYERLLKGLWNYYDNGGQREVVLHFVGDGPELNTYRELTTSLKLEGRVKFYGYINRDSIAPLYDKANLAVDVFGGYKKDMVLSCSLKTREYIAAGLPIVCGSAIDIQQFKEFKPYILELPNDCTSLDFTKIIDFFDKIYSTNEITNPQQIADDIRSIGIRYLNCENSMREIIERLENEE